MSQVGDVLDDRYRLVRLVGHGGMSDVYEANDSLSGASVAIKLVRSNDPEFARRLDREARALESLEHPGLIRLLDTGVSGGQAYLVMDYVDGPTLAESLREGPLAPALVARLGAELADTLAYVHERGRVHRDVKPSNILRSSDGRAWLGDFGIALLHDATSITALGTTVGTVTYMAPEQFEGHDVSAPADVWALGVVLLECLTGKRVFEGAPSEVVARRLRGPVTLAADLPVPWKMLLGAMLESRPESRPSSSEVASMLAAPAFKAPWRPAEEVAPIVVAASDETRVAKDETRVMHEARPMAGDPDATARASIATPSAPTPRRDARWVAIGVVALLAVLALWWLLSSSGTSSPPPTSTTTTSTTTTSVTTSAKALATLLQALSSAQSAQTLAAPLAQSVALNAQQALVDWNARNYAQVESDLQQGATTLANAPAQGQATPSAVATLQNDLALLAGSLGVAPPSASVSTTTLAPPPGHGHGHGHG